VGTAAPRDFRGNSGNNVITGGPSNDVFRLQDGGDDTVYGLGGRDVFYFGAAFTAADTVDGGEQADILGLQGDYSAGVTFGTGTTSNIISIESISLFSGSTAAYGDTSGASYSYVLNMLDGNVAAGTRTRVNGFALLAGENMTLNGAAESDGSFEVFAGRGIDDLTGGAKGDVFFFGHDGRFGAGDSVDGGGGSDIVYLRGDYAIDFNAAGYDASTFVGVESIGLLAFADQTFTSSGDGEFDYDLVWNDAMLGAGETISVNGSRLGASETMAFDGSDESAGAFRLFGGAAADDLAGGAGADLLYGGGGGDTLAGNGGADVFRYQAVSDSTTSAIDQILQFVQGEDKIDLSRIDAIAATPGNEAFTFIGGAAFTGAGQLRATLTDEPTNRWTIEGDVDGDGNADLIISGTVGPGQSLEATDFFL
jgi:hypothetical protein